MERRLAVICSHFRQGGGAGRPVAAPPAAFSDGPPRGGGGVSPSPCDGRRANEEDEAESAREKGNYCIFCAIVRGEAPAYKLYEDDICLCFLDSNPLTYGHSLIVPKSHYTTLEATPPLVVAAMCSTIPFLSTAIMKVTKCDSFNLLVNSGEAAGQVIFHTHLHIIPRKADDCLWTSESVRRKPLKLNIETAKLADRVRQQLSFPAKSSGTCENQESKLGEDS